MAKLPDSIGRPDEVWAFLETAATRGDPASVLATMDHYATNHTFLMNVGPEKGRLLAREVDRVGPSARIVEFGVYCGYSAVMIATRLDTRGRLISVENDPESVRVARKIVAFAGLEERVEILEGSSSEVIPSLEGPFDLVFLDHWKDLYEGDLKAMETAGLLQPGSIIFADNVGPHFNPESYLEYVRTCGRYESEHFESTIEYTDLPDAAEISVFKG